MDDLDLNPDGQYKFGSIEINIDTNLNRVSRETYQILDWLGDVGGLTDAILFIIQFLLLPVQ